MNDQPRGEPEAEQPEMGQAGQPEAEEPEAEPGPETLAAEPGRKRLGRALGRAVERSAERSPRMGALAQRAQRAQQNAREGLASARKAPAVERAFEAGRTAREAAKPRLSKAREGMQQRVADHPDATAKVARALTIAVIHAAAATRPENASLKKSAPAMGDQVGKAVSKLIARTQHHTPGEAADEAPEGAAAIEAGTASDPATAAGVTAGDVGPDAGADVGPAELAASLGVRPPPDPAALYREGPGTFELVLPLPRELASLPWDSLSRRNRFGLLVAAWALRESDGITLLKGGELDQAGEVFQECLIRAQYVRTSELVARSYEDLAELATVSGDENAARTWRSAAAQAEAAQAEEGERGN